MLTILKYPLEIEDEQVLSVFRQGISQRAKPLSVGLDLEGKPAIWMLCDPQTGMKDATKVFICMTGAPMPEGSFIHETGHLKATHVGTFNYMEHIWHVFVQ